MKIKDVEAMVLKSSQAYAAPTGAEESHGIGYMLVIKVTTDKGLTGYSDVETQPHVAKAVIDAPAGGAGLIMVCGKPFWVKIRLRSKSCGTRCTKAASTLAGEVWPSRLFLGLTTASGASSARP